MYKTLLILVLSTLLIGCTHIKYVEVPKEIVHTEYQTQLVHDSIYQLDSIFIKEMNDTILIEKYKYKTKYNTVRDTIVVNDTIVNTVIKNVETVKEVNKLHTWQKILMSIGVILSLLLIGYFIIKLKK